MRTSIVIPAHDEASTIRRCLRGVADSGVADDVEVVVAANGCTDRTAEVARTFAPHLRHLDVLDLPEPSKVAALNRADARARTLPRIYLDADIELGPGSLESLVAALEEPGARVAAPRPHFDLDGSSWAVRAFYRAFVALPYVAEDLTGLGVYGLSAEGRGRFGRFPDLVADDLFVQRLFAPEERVVSEGHFVIRAPRDLRSLLRVRTRVAQGNAELVSAAGLDDGAGASTTSATVRALLRLVARRPSMAVPALVYAVVVGLARRRAAAGPSTWGRDGSTREAGSPGPSGDSGDLDTAAAAASVDLDGVALTAWTEERAVSHVMDELDHGRGGVILTPNVDILRQLTRDDHDALLEQTDLVVADGMPLIWASRIQGTPLPERVTGADLVWSLSRTAADRGRSVFLLGGADGVPERAGEELTAAFPDLKIAGCASPPRGFQDDPARLAALVEQVAAASPDLVFVAMGFPKQERLALELREALPRTWFLGCGGALDMAAGDLVRASPGLQSLGVEWVHRLALEPKRLARRYLVDDLPYALALLARSSGRRFTGRRQAPARG